MIKQTSRYLSAGIMVSMAFLSACEGLTVEEPEPYVKEQKDRIRQQSGTVHGDPRGIVIYSTKDDADGGDSAGASAGTQGATATAGVQGANAYLWQASLESLDFMPLAQADSQGGVIISDWYAPPETPDERFKVTVYILDRALRADALKVAVFRQMNGGKGWVDAEVDQATAAGLENNILKRARELRLADGATG